MSCALVGGVLCVVGAVEVLAAEAALGAGHVAADDEVGAPVVAADDHVLDGLTGASHVHGVRQVRPAELRIVHLRCQHLVRPEANDAGDVIVLQLTPTSSDTGVGTCCSGTVERYSEKGVVLM